jgi:hypothetical protein
MTIKICNVITFCGSLMDLIVEDAFDLGVSSEDLKHFEYFNELVK